jgi:hypothetical protein
MQDRRVRVDHGDMRRLSTLLGLVQEIAIVAWALAAVWVVLPGGAQAAGGTAIGFALAAAAIAILAGVRRLIGARASGPAGAPTLG